MENIVTLIEKWIEIEIGYQIYKRDRLNFKRYDLIFVRFFYPRSQMFEMANELEKVKEEKEKATKEFTKLQDKIKVNEFLHSPWPWSCQLYCYKLTYEMK